MVTIEEVNDALREVIDPELGLDFVELGLIYGVDIDEAGAIKVTYTLTTPGCPIGPTVEGQMQEFVSEIEGVSSVESELVFTPPWSPDLMSDDAKFALGF
jgi:metal-sulfur cluster biosynthetic enzyme